MIEFTVCSWNIHHGAGLDGRLDLGRVAGALHDAAVHVAGLQEVEVAAVRSRFVNQPANLARRLGMKGAFGPSFRLPVAGEFGNAVLSRFPIRKTAVHAMPSGREPRSVMEAHLETEQGLVAVFVTHWGLDPAERPGQARECVRLIEAFQGAALLLGDLNEGPEGSAVAVLRNAGLVSLGPGEHTYPADDPTESIDYIWGTPGWKARDAYAMPVLASDHRPVFAEVMHP